MEKGVRTSRTWWFIKPDRLSSQLQGCIAVGTPSFSWLPELLLLSPGFGFFMAHGNPASSVYAAQKKDLLVELWPGSPRRRGDSEDRVMREKTQGGMDRKNAKDRGRRS
ncbi:hypothetical protein MG293_018716 [Ovis ammon polii]|uniref:Uncharacterized protein n=1 Tax=Ovis ammon polii TaxID=230172 RepID=A0AAD4TN91_OVIAM|nr:hypothetical protein MG293_018716 [Ovis ammon polii]